MAVQRIVEHWSNPHASSIFISRLIGHERATIHGLAVDKTLTMNYSEACRIASAYGYKYEDFKLIETPRS